MGCTVLRGAVSVQQMPWRPAGQQAWPSLLPAQLPGRLTGYRGARRPLARIAFCGAQEPLLRWLPVMASRAARHACGVQPQAKLSWRLGWFKAWCQSGAATELPAV